MQFVYHYRNFDNHPIKIVQFGGYVLRCLGDTKYIHNIDLSRCIHSNLEEFFVSKNYLNIRDSLKKNKEYPEKILNYKDVGKPYCGVYVHPAIALEIISMCEDDKARFILNQLVLKS
jgi:hypothetical protein